MDDWDLNHQISALNALPARIFYIKCVFRQDLGFPTRGGDVLPHELASCSLLGPWPPAKGWGRLSTRACLLFPDGTLASRQGVGTFVPMSLPIVPCWDLGFLPRVGTFVP
ncbi:unnamed protein product [Cuscuta europaea]|uniref:Uncharacterized protein n=1 Tax=Cuscuta europaea TaxID=41803 RepID=A0A9P1EN95_CUSEU|nr:unnamed protein product [Cuscuta europaea]